MFGMYSHGESSATRADDNSVKENHQLMELKGSFTKESLLFKMVRIFMEILVLWVNIRDPMTVEITFIKGMEDNSLPLIEVWVVLMAPDTLSMPRFNGGGNGAFNTEIMKFLWFLCQ